MNGVGVASPIGSTLVCHREPLLAAAAAAALKRRRVCSRTVTTSSLTGALSGLSRGVDLAVVFDGGDEQVSDLFEAIRYRGVATPVVVVSEMADAEYAAQVLQAGAAGVVPVELPAADLCQALVGAARGQIVVAGEMRGAVLEVLRRRRIQRYEAQAQLAELTPLDVDILRLLCDGATVSRIAARLSLSPHTIRGRVRAIGTHLGVAGQLRVASVGRRLLAAAAPLGLRSRTEGLVGRGHQRKRLASMNGRAYAQESSIRHAAP